MKSVALVALGMVSASAGAANLTWVGGAEGEFENFPDGKYVDSCGNKFRIDYAGGDGNDIVLTCRGNGFAIVVR